MMICGPTTSLKGTKKSTRADSASGARISAAILEPSPEIVARDTKKHRETGASICCVIATALDDGERLFELREVTFAEEPDVSLDSPPDVSSLGALPHGRHTDAEAVSRLVRVEVGAITGWARIHYDQHRRHRDGITRASF